eukprot:1037010-Pyramimonas_sp.AAC.1
MVPSHGLGAAAGRDWASAHACCTCSDALGSPQGCRDKQPRCPPPEGGGARARRAAARRALARA